MNLLPRIVVGKRYRLRIRPNPEYRFPCCGEVVGKGSLERHPELQGAVVTVVERCSHVWCPECGIPFDVPDGIWGTDCRNDSGRYSAIPYTWLEPLADEDYTEEKA